MGKFRKTVIAASAVAVAAVGLGSSPAEAATKKTWGGIDVAGCLSTIGVETFEGLYMAIGAEAGSDLSPCSTLNSTVRVVADLYLLPTDGGRTTVKMMTAVGRCNQSSDCARTQGFAAGIMPPGIYKLVGTITVDNVGPGGVVTKTINGPSFTYLVNDIS